MRGALLGLAWLVVIGVLLVSVLRPRRTVRRPRHAALLKVNRYYSRNGR